MRRHIEKRHALSRLVRVALLAIAVYAFGGLEKHGQRARDYRQAFAQAGGSYAGMRLAHGGIGTGLLAARVLPEGARFDMSGAETLLGMGARYGAYPSAVNSPGADFFIVLAKDDHPEARQGWTGVRLANGVPIFARPGVGLPHAGRAARNAALARSPALLRDAGAGNAAGRVAARGIRHRRAPGRGGLVSEARPIWPGFAVWTGLVWLAMIAGRAPVRRLACGRVVLASVCCRGRIVAAPPRLVRRNRHPRIHRVRASIRLGGLGPYCAAASLCSR